MFEAGERGGGEREEDVCVYVYTFLSWESNICIS